VLLDAATEAAAEAGTRVLRAAGAEFEADLAFSALNLLLSPIHGELERLRPVHRDALFRALGFSDGTPPDRLVVSTATMALLRQAAEAQPLLLVVDDVHWLDRASAAVLGFVGRRLAGSRVGLIASSRTSTESFFGGEGLPAYELPPLDDDAAARLLEAWFPTLATKVRHAWHRADATVESDEDVAGLLEHAARRGLRRGDAIGAVAALLRAADLSPRGADRSRRLAEAAYVGADVAGELRDASRLLADARQADPGRGGSLQAAVTTAFLLINGEGDIDTAHRLLTGAIATRAGRYDANDSALIEALHMLCTVCFFGGRPELWACSTPRSPASRPQNPPP
jgi:hypothetical protein